MYDHENFRGSWKTLRISIRKKHNKTFNECLLNDKPYCNTQKNNDWKHQENHWGRCPLGCKDGNLDVDSDQNMANEVTFS